MSLLIVIHDKISQNDKFNIINILISGCQLLTSEVTHKTKKFKTEITIHKKIDINNIILENMKKALEFYGKNINCIKFHTNELIVFTGELHDTDKLYDYVEGLKECHI